MKYFLIILLLLLISASTLTIYLQLNYPATSPLVTVTYMAENIGHKHAKTNRQLIGFLPYWRLDDSKYLRTDLMSEVIFFSLSADENGQIIKVDDGQTDPGWRWWNSSIVKDLITKTQVGGGRFSLTIAMQRNKTLEAFLDNPSSQQKLIQNLLKIVKEERLNGLNVDFEYGGEPDAGYRGKFTAFAQNLTSSFRTNSPKTILSIDFFPLSVEKPRLYDVAKLAPLFDRVIVMSYDYYSTSSKVAGPVAPMGGYKEGKYFFDIQTTYEDYLKIVPREKIVMGIPYYGWDFPVEDKDQPLSQVLPKNDTNGYPAVMSYGRMRDDTDINQDNCRWDELAAATWCSYLDSESQVPHQAWIEDNRSIGTKFDFAKAQNLGGIAIWTLGYDKNYPDLWQMISDKFTEKI
ncbi:MAG: glycosyl hydrolase family 18 protein [bacterium]|nr:glycosyl hydrolase family 18 protein [bacterium]